jgi:hypothetical protein
VLVLAVGQNRGRGQETAGRSAVPRPVIAAIVQAFGEHRIVGVGDAHGNRLGEALQRALISDPAFLAVVDDLVVESGNSRYQDLADRFVGGEVDPAALRRIWLDATQQQVASSEVPERPCAARRSEGPGCRRISDQRPGTCRRSGLPWRCDEPAWPERLRRANLQRPGLGDRVKTQCVP